MYGVGEAMYVVAVTAALVSLVLRAVLEGRWSALLSAAAAAVVACAVVYVAELLDRRRWWR